VGRCPYLDHASKPKLLECEIDNSSMALWGLITCIHYSGRMVTSVTKDIPRRYVVGRTKFVDGNSLKKLRRLSTVGYHGYTLVQVLNISGTGRSKERLMWPAFLLCFL
jgi:hypothetical protein